MSDETSHEIDDVLDANVDVADDGALELLQTGEIEILGRMPWSSNATFLVTVTDGDRRCQAIYKPEAGERPLWDFPTGLWRREVGAYVLATELGWPVIPPTVERSDADLGVGSVQFFVPSRFEQHYFTFKDDDTHRRALREICLLDVVMNNTDRKGGHILLANDGRLWGIDHGVSFHEEFKLRTVMWDYSGERIDVDLLDDLVRWVDGVATTALRGLIDDDEIDAVCERARRIIAAGVYPSDPSGQRYPWPMV